MHDAAAGRPFPRTSDWNNMLKVRTKTDIGRCHYDVRRLRMRFPTPTMDQSTRRIIQLGYNMERLCYPAWFEVLGREADLAYRDVFPNQVKVHVTDRRESMDRIHIQYHQGTG